MPAGCAFPSRILSSSAGRSRARSTCLRSAFRMGGHWSALGRCESFWHGIKPERPRNRMASQQALDGEPCAARKAESLDRLVGILRTRGPKPATSGEEMGEVRLIHTQRKECGTQMRGWPKGGLQLAL